MVLALAVIVVGVRRLQLLRGAGTRVVLRSLPADEGRGWRHGVLCYRQDRLDFYRVSSIRLGADRRLNRRGLEVSARRTAVSSERDAVPAGATVLRLDDGTRELEVALGGGALTALLSWLESSPPARRRREGR